MTNIFTLTFIYLIQVNVSSNLLLMGYNTDAINKDPDFWETVILTNWLN